MKRLATITLLAALALSACGSNSKTSNDAHCVDKQNRVVDPALCQQARQQASGHENDTSWLTAFLLYHWAFGGHLNGMNYVGGRGYQVYEPLPPKARYADQRSYVNVAKKAKVTVTTIAPPKDYAPPTTAKPATTAPKTTSPPKTSSDSKTTSAPKSTSKPASTPKPAASSSGSRSSSSATKTR